MVVLWNLWESNWDDGEQEMEEKRKMVSSRGTNTRKGQVKVHPLRASQRDPETTELEVRPCGNLSQAPWQCYPDYRPIKT